MSTKKTPKAKAKKTSIPPPEGWQIVSKNDPRLDKLPTTPLYFDPGTSLWAVSGWEVGQSVSVEDREMFTYAVPTATQSATPKPAAKAKPAAQPAAQPAAEPAPPMIRLRLPSEKPTKEDGDGRGHIVVFYKTGDCCGAWLWKTPFEERVIAWLPGHLPDGILPKPPTQEEKWRKEFEECMADLYGMERRDGNPDVYSSHYTQSAWEGFLASKKSTK